MKAPSVQLSFLLDASAPESVAVAIEKAGHKAIRHNDVLAEGATDIVVCETALANKAILIAVDKDMKQLTKRFNPDQARLKKLSMVQIACNAVMASKRLEQALTMIEHEWAVSQKKAAARLWFEISNHRLTTYR